MDRAREDNSGTEGNDHRDDSDPQPPPVLDIQTGVSPLASLMREIKHLRREAQSRDGEDGQQHGTPAITTTAAGADKREAGDGGGVEGRRGRDSERGDQQEYVSHALIYESLSRRARTGRNKSGMRRERANDGGFDPNASLSTTASSKE